MLDLNKFKLDVADLDRKEEVQVEKVSNRDIAIIGVACKFPGADNTREFWHNLRQGLDLIGPLPRTRKADADAYLTEKGFDLENIEYGEAAYLKEIDKFDPAFFKISPKEASVMDPNQRLFLQVAWQAIEDAGYGGKKLAGTETGMYLGYSSDFGYEYKQLVGELEPALSSLSTAGNIKSIIASRIAYILDLKGPSMVVDTACSSALTAIHLACSALRNGECEQALAGAVKINLLPLKAEDGIGIKSSSNRARTFDDSSDGTGLGEGCAVIILKPLKKALEDGDAIYALIKGSAVNQDGTSVGITAPNALAQAAVIEKAWKDAGIDPESVSYIEAHGTGTKLGDPIEIDGITRAFRKYTRKSQFCGIGSVKTNIGHLDNAAGIASVLKVVLALKNRQIPASLHFQKPNQKIDFTSSPVYVVDSLRDWREGETPRRAGISAFGLSGTNVHMILEEAPAKKVGGSNTPDSLHLLTISASSQSVFETLLDSYRTYVESTDTINLLSMCYTANTGRGHYAYRAALLVEDLEDCKKKLAAVRLGATLPEGVLCAQVKAKKEEERAALTAKAQDKVEKLAAMPQQAGTAEYQQTLAELAVLYIEGADVEWQQLYAGEKIAKLNLPVYPFEQKRCWVGATFGQLVDDEAAAGAEGVAGLEGTATGGGADAGNIHPLLETCIEDTPERTVFRTYFSPEKHWVLSEHKVGGTCVVPGTSYLEMARCAGRQFYPDGAIRFRDVIFISPLIVNSGDQKEVQMVIKKCGDYLEFSVISEDGLVKHSEGKIFSAEMEEHNYNLAELTRQKDKVTIDYNDPNLPSMATSSAIEIGPRWQNLREIYVGEGEVLGYLELDDQFASDMEQFYLHPSLMDRAVNVASQHVGQGLYLPFSYKDMRVFGPSPNGIFSYLRKKKETENQETITFDLTLLDKDGHAFAEVTDYTIKKVHQVSRFKDFAGTSFYYQMNWVPRTLPGGGRKELRDGAILVLKDSRGHADQLIAELRGRGREVLEVLAGNEYQGLTNGQWVVRDVEEDYINLATELKGQSIVQVIDLFTAGESAASEFTELVQQERLALHSLLYLAKALINQKVAKNLDLVLISDHGNAVLAEDERINPLHASFFGLGKVIGQEYPVLRVKCIDVDTFSDIPQIIEEMHYQTSTTVAYRNGQRYIEEFGKLEIDTLPTREFRVKSDGIYLITGGTGGLGLAMAKFLAEQAQAQEATVNLALINRSTLPARSEWVDILAKDTDAKLCHKLHMLQEIEALGTTIELLGADTANPEQMTEVITTLRQRYGRINGIIHGAGVAGDGFLLRKDDQIFDAVVTPKTRGTWLIEHLTREDRPDFIVLMSSINSIIGGQGQGDYAAANAYLDAYAEYAKLSGLPVISINWPAWKEIGMAADFGVKGGIFGAIAPEKGIEILQEILVKDLHRVVIGDLNYALIARQEATLPLMLSQEIVAAMKNKQNRMKSAATPEPQAKETKAKKAVQVAIKGRDEAEYNETEVNVARIWGEVLGLDSVDIYENFYDLGGDSILATHLLKAMDKQFPGMVDISDIFTYPTVSGMAEYIEGRLQKAAPQNSTAATSNTQAGNFADGQSGGTGAEGAAGTESPDGGEDLTDMLDQILSQLESGELSADDAEILTARRDS